MRKPSFYWKKLPEPKRRCNTAASFFRGENI